MKKMIKRYRVLFYAVLFGVLGQACSDKTQEVFDLSASERAEEHRAACENTLTANTNGWIVDYYPEAETYGGYTFIMKFNTDGTVEMTPEDAYFGTADTATYRVHTGQSTVLTFDTYSQFHLLSDAEVTEEINGTTYYVNYGRGYEGDFELACIEISDTLLVFEGVKRGYRITMRPLTDGNIDSYLAAQNEIHTLLDSVGGEGFFLKSGSDSLEVTHDNFHFFQVYSVSGSDYVGDASPFVVTNTGLRMYHSVGVNGNEASEFTWNEMTQRFESAEGLELIPGGTARGGFTNPAEYKIYNVDLSNAGSSFLSAIDELEASMKALVANPANFGGLTRIRYIMNGYPTAQAYYGGSHRIDIYSSVDFEEEQNLYLIGTTPKSLYETAFNYAISFSDGEGGTAGYTLFHSLVNEWMTSEMYGTHVFTVEEKTRWSMGQAIVSYRLTRNDDANFWFDVVQTDEL